MIFKKNDPISGVYIFFGLKFGSNIVSSEYILNRVASPGDWRR